jgi:hypothetical protein
MQAARWLADNDLARALLENGRCYAWNCPQRKVATHLDLLVVSWHETPRKLQIRSQRPRPWYLPWAIQCLPIFCFGNLGDSLH